MFVARDVQVEGNAAIAADDIIRAANLPLGSPMREVSEEKMCIRDSKGVKHPFDEKIVVKELLREMRGK